MKDRGERLWQLLVERIGARMDCDFGPWRGEAVASPMADKNVCPTGYDLLAEWIANLPGEPDHLHVTARLPRYGRRKPTKRQPHERLLPIYDDPEQKWLSELDHLLQTRLLPVDALEAITPERLALVAEIRDLGRQLIAPFAQQQRQLAEAWRKDATVHSTDYAMTIDRVPKKFHAEICRCAAQVATWRELFAIDADEAVQPAFLAEHPHLVLDTRYFDASFRRRLLRTLDKVDEQVDGILIHGENAAALRWLRSQPLSEVKCVFTDPPYNTGSGVWTYADRFEHAAWQTMMRDRLAAARELMAPGAAMFVVLDDHEQARLRLLLDELFGEENFLATIVWEKVHTRKNSARHFSVSHDYIVAFARDKRRWRRQLLPRDDTSAYANPDADPRGPWKVDPVYANKPYAAEYAIEKPNGVALAPPTGRYWRFSEATFAGKAAAGEVVWGNGSAYPMVKRYLADVQDGLVPTTLFSRTLAGDNASAAAELRAMFGGAPRVSYPKPSLLARRIVQIATEPNGRDVVLDFFAGSGSTVQGVIDQNRTDGGNRRWVAVEHGDCFDTLLVPRVMKSICASRWKQGKPASNDGVSQVVKIVRLEAFEESLARQID